MSNDADVLIVGGGCAGLSLATALAQHAPALRVHTLEQRQRYTRDRTWCFWNTETHPFAAAVTHRWQRWRVRHAGREAVQQSGRYSYDHVPADRFYELAQAAATCASQQLSLGVAVRGVRQDGDRCEVETDRGVLRAPWVFDARPWPAGTSSPALMQRFTGWHVRTEQPCFQPAQVELMDFKPAAVSGRAFFVYVLPYSATEALVEATYLDDPTLAPADAQAAVREYLLAAGSGAYEVLYREAGALAMGGRLPAGAGSRIVNIGSRGGRLKPSSGYAFLRIQRQSQALAKALAAGTPLPQRFEPRAYPFLDSTFLHALRLHPERAPGYFLALFRQLPPDPLVRFLSETASPGEMLRVMLALPKLDFLQAALGTLQGAR